MTNNPALATRSGLPDALKVLLEAYPRQGWTTDPGFDDTVQFWLDRHLMFRRLMTEMLSVTESVMDKSIDTRRFAAALSRYGGMFVNGLHEHHTIEDTYYFPKLSAHDPRILTGFEMLETDHHALDGVLQTLVTQANASIAAAQDHKANIDASGGLHGTLLQMQNFLDRHLTDEEELIVPVILKFGSPHHG